MSNHKVHAERALNGDAEKAAEQRRVLEQAYQQIAGTGIEAMLLITTPVGASEGMVAAIADKQQLGGLMSRVVDVVLPQFAKNKINIADPASIVDEELLLLELSSMLSSMSDVVRDHRNDAPELARVGGALNLVWMQVLAALRDMLRRVIPTMPQGPARESRLNTLRMIEAKLELGGFNKIEAIARAMRESKGVNL